MTELWVKYYAIVLQILWETDWGGNNIEAHRYSNGHAYITLHYKGLNEVPSMITFITTYRRSNSTLTQLQTDGFVRVTLVLG